MHDEYIVEDIYCQNSIDALSSIVSNFKMTFDEALNAYVNPDRDLHLAILGWKRNVIAIELRIFPHRSLKCYTIYHEINTTNYEEIPNIVQSQYLYYSINRDASVIYKFDLYEPEVKRFAETIIKDYCSRFFPVKFTYVFNSIGRSIEYDSDNLTDSHEFQTNKKIVIGIFQRYGVDDFNIVCIDRHAPIDLSNLRYQIEHNPKIQNDIRLSNDYFTPKPMVNDILSIAPKETKELSFDELMNDEATDKIIRREQGILANGFTPNPLTNNIITLIEAKLKRSKV